MPIRRHCIRRYSQPSIVLATALLCATAAHAQGGETFKIAFIDPLSGPDRKSTRLNSSHLVISYAVFCLKKKTKTSTQHNPRTHTTPHIDPITYRTLLASDSR